MQHHEPRVCPFWEAALTFAGVWDFETGLRATQLRGELMEAHNSGHRLGR